jgi:hypothetical protein
MNMSARLVVAIAAIICAARGGREAMNDRQMFRWRRVGLSEPTYARSEILDSEVTVLNSKSALYRGTFSRQRSDGSEISRLTATYLVTDGAAGRRISVLAVHSP